LRGPEKIVNTFLQAMQGNPCAFVNWTTGVGKRAHAAHTAAAMAQRVPWAPVSRYRRDTLAARAALR
jgi:hypothetical protein